MKDNLLESSAAVVVGPVGNEGGRSPSTLSIGQAVAPGGLAPGQRWSGGRKREVVLRLMGCGIEARWQAKRKTGASMVYVGLVRGS
jgi:hypothetical protein